MAKTKSPVKRIEFLAKMFEVFTQEELEEVSNNEAPLKALMFLEKSDINKIDPLIDTKEIIIRRL